MIIKYPLATEKAIMLLELNNMMVFVVDKSANKQEIKKALEKMYGIKIKKVNTAIDTKNRKKAYVKFSEETPAIDLATKLGII